MRKLLLLLLCALLVGGSAAHAASVQDWLQRTAPGDDHRQVQAGTQLTVGTATAMSGYFATDLWGVNTADLDVRNLLHGYQTVVWSQERPWFNGLAIKSVTAQSVMDGAQVFVMEIADGLTYNDGTPITAQDYVFSLLLEASAAVEALGGAARDLRYIQGFEAYRAGETGVFAGVYLISPMEFAVEITQDALMDYYGPELLRITPYPISIIAPGYEVRDEGSGAFLVKDEMPGGLTTELLAETLLDPAEGYARNPRVTCGPYMLEDLALSEGRVSFTLNPRFAGDAWGVRPVIEKLDFVVVDEADIAQKLAFGEIGLINKAFNPTVVSQCRTVQGLSETMYDRTGLAYLAFATERGAGSNANVRLAIAMALDRDALVSKQPDFVRVHGLYGPGQWMLREASKDVLDALPSLDIPYDPEGAKRLVSAYCASENIPEPLQVVFARSAQSRLADTVEWALRDGLSSIGMELQVVSLSFDDLLAQYYHQQDRVADVYFLGEDFPAAFNPLNGLSGEADAQGYRNATSVNDTALAARAKAMLLTGFGNRSGYTDGWLAFQSRFMEVLPMIPLYSGAYHDFYTDGLAGYDVAVKGSWALAIVGAYFERE